MGFVAKGLVFLGKVLVGGAGVNAVATFAARVAFSVGLSVLSSRLFGPKVPDSTIGLTERSVTVRGTLEYRKIVYGEALVSGPIAYTNLSGGNGQHLWYVVALADGESESLEAVYFDGNRIAAANIDWTPGANGANGVGTGEVTAGDYYNATDDFHAVRLYWTLGHPDQVALNVLTSEFSDLDSKNRGRGITYLVARLTYQQESEEIWEEKGEPNNIKALLRGRKCYDRRLYALNADPNFETLDYPVGGGLRWFTDNTPPADEGGAEAPGAGGTFYASDFWASDFWAEDFWA